MGPSRWQIAAVCVTAIVGFTWALTWLVDHAYTSPEPGRLAYKPVDDMPPRVDLAAVQRGWPNSLGETGDYNELTAYLRDNEGKAPAPTAAKKAASEAPVDLGTLLAAADANAGKDKAKACVSCHDFTQGGPNRIGPNLWGVVGRDIGGHAGFAYSSVMTGAPGSWTYEQLFTYLASPARSMPGTKMSFAGLRRPEDRAAVIKYLATLGNSPPLPQPQARPQPAAGASKAR